MKRLASIAVAAIGLAVLFGTPQAVRMQAAPSVAPASPSTVQGDLVIDFLGAVRGFVEPCG